MSEPFIAEVRMWGCNFAPRGWALCEGQLLPIAQNTALFSLVGTTYGGDGRTTLGLPNLQGRAPMHPGRGPGLTPRTLGQTGGTETETLDSNQIPAHNHNVVAAPAPSVPVNSPVGNLPVAAAGRGAASLYGTGSPGNMSDKTVVTNGGGQAHNNLQPFLAVTFTIALVGQYPSRS